jgi:repressor LexA
MHPIQEKLLALAKKKNLAEVSLREMAKLIGEPASPQKIKHHLTQLKKKGFFQLEKARGITEMTPKWTKTVIQKGRHLLSLPIIGTANCGPADVFAEVNFHGFLKVSDRILGRSIGKGLYAVKADGSSMNMTDFDGKKIEDGDFVIIDSNRRSPQGGEVVLAVIDNKATIKRFINDKENKQIVLMADSTYDYEPIYLDSSDDFIINGTVVSVIKKPTIKYYD